MEIININDDRWDSTVKSFKSHPIYFLENYCKSFMQENEVPQLFYYEENGLRAMNVMFKRTITKLEGFREFQVENDYYDLISPYGYGGWMIEGGNSTALYKVYRKYCELNNIICEFVRFDLFRNDIIHYPGHLKSLTHNVVKQVDILEEEIYNEFEYRVKKNIKKAIKNDLEVLIDESHEFLDSFLEIYYGTMDRNNADSQFYFNKSFFENMSRQNAIYFHISNEGKIISTELVLYDNMCAYSYLGGTIDEYFHLRPTELLKFEIMKWAHKKGLKYFVLGGGYGSDDGIFNYKKGLSPNGVMNFFTGNDIFNQDVYNQLCEYAGVEASQTNFFPAYRANLK